MGIETVLSSVYGVRVSDLTKISVLSKDDILLVSKWNDKSNKYESYSQQMETIISDMANSIKEDIGFTELAEKQWFQYSLSNHTHDYEYTYLSAEQLCDFMSVQSAYYKIADIIYTDPGSESITDSNISTIEIQVPEINYGKPPAPEIGTVKFVYHDQDAQIQDNQTLVEDPNFDGWVYPNGDNVVVDFNSDIISDYNGYPYSIVGINKSTKKYTLKLCNLDGFFGGVCQNSGFEQYSDQQIGLKKHCHVIDPISMDARLDVDSSNTTFDAYKSKTPGTQSKNNIHLYSDSTEYGTTTFNLNLGQLYIPDVTTKPFKSENQTYAPRHNKIPVMIYIGARKFVLDFEGQHNIIFKTVRGIIGYFAVSNNRCFDVKNGYKEVQKITYPVSNIDGLEIRWLDNTYEDYTDFSKITSDITISGVWNYSDVLDIDYGDSEIYDYYNEKILDPSQLYAINVSDMDNKKYYILHDSDDEDNIITISIDDV